MANRNCFEKGLKNILNLRTKRRHFVIARKFEKFSWQSITFYLAIECFLIAKTIDCFGFALQGRSRKMRVCYIINLRFKVGANAYANAHRKKLNAFLEMTKNHANSGI